jgi:hypothetical protein
MRALIAFEVKGDYLCAARRPSDQRRRLLSDLYHRQGLSG